MVDQVYRVTTVLREASHSDRDRQRAGRDELLALEISCLCFSHDSSAQYHSVFLTGAREDYGEFFSAVAGHYVGGSTGCT